MPAREMLASGGNAIDAGVAAIFAAAVVEISHFGLGGEAPIIVYSARDRKVTVINGQGPAPRAATPSMFAGKDSIPGNGPLGGTVPAAVDSASVALARFGTKSLADVLAPAIRLADGFPMYEFLHHYLETERAACEPYAWTMSTYYPGGRITPVGEIFRQPNLAATLRLMSKADSDARARGATREKGDRGRARCVLLGATARDIAAAVKDAGGVMTEEDLASYHSKIEEPRLGSLSRLYRLQDRILEPGPSPAADAEDSRRIRPARHGPGLGGRAAHDRRSDQAGLCGSRPLLRRSGLRACAGRGSVVGAVRGCPSRVDRRQTRQPGTASRRSSQRPGR